MSFRIQWFSKSKCNDLERMVIRCDILHRKAGGILLCSNNLLGQWCSPAFQPHLAYPAFGMLSESALFAKLALLSPIAYLPSVCLVAQISCSDINKLKTTPTPNKNG